MPGSLSTYRKKRDPKKTPEPVPAAGPQPRGNDDTFVIQEHHATALHWDFRLERDGVLVSWAVPKGLPLDQTKNHLAVHTEDHPLEYASFEGEIPQGEYGGGRVILWDRGTYECEKWTDTKVQIVLHGERVSGRYVLIHTKDKQWLMRRMDPPPRTDWEPLPELIRPMLASPGQLPRDDDKYAYEFKWDGVRAVVYIEGGRVRVLTRNDREVSGTYPELRALGESLGTTQLVLDGEIVAFDKAGRPSFGTLQNRMHVTSQSAVRRLMNEVPIAYLVFDVLHHDGRSTLSLPYADRRNLLESLQLSGPCWQTPPSFVGGGADVFAAAQKQGLEGVVAKRLDSPYLPGKRSPTWTKVKAFRTQEVIVGGWSPGEGRRTGTIGSLLLGVPDENGGLRYAGHVGTGFTERMLRDLQARLKPLELDSSPFADEVPRAHARDAHWIKPKLVGEVEFAEWTREGRLRHPSWRGLRDDKLPEEVVRES